MLHRRASGFTLIELLVVISIISLLVAILLPVLSAARQTAQMTNSLSNIRQITIALHTYAGDNNSRLPNNTVDPWQVSPSPNSAGTRPRWTGRLYHKGYIESVGVFWSPGRDVGWVDFEWLPKTVIHEHWAMTGYHANDVGAMSWSHGNFPFLGYGPTLALDGASNPPASDHLLLYEAFNPSAYPETDGGGDTPFSYNGGVVRSYVDGHAAARDGEDMHWEIHGPRSATFNSPTGNRWVEPYYDFRWTGFWGNTWQ